MLPPQAVCGRSAFIFPNDALLVGAESAQTGKSLLDRHRGCLILHDHSLNIRRTIAEGKCISGTASCRQQLICVISSLRRLQLAQFAGETPLGMGRCIKPLQVIDFPQIEHGSRFVSSLSRMGAVEVTNCQRAEKQRRAQPGICPQNVSLHATRLRYWQS